MNSLAYRSDVTAHAGPSSGGFLEEHAESGLQYSRFAIGDRPYCVWDPELAAKNLRFIEQLDPAFFGYQADAHAAALESEERQRAAIALRIAYSHGLETFFSLVAASVQASDCVVGYLTNCWPKQVRGVISKIGHGANMYSKVGDISRSWDRLSSAVNVFALDDPARTAVLASLFARLWARFAHDFLDVPMRSEYNSLKHGLRAAFGAFHWRLGKNPPMELLPLPINSHTYRAATLAPRRFTSIAFKVTLTSALQSATRIGIR